MWSRCVEAPPSLPAPFPARGTRRNTRTPSWKGTNAQLAGGAVDLGALPVRPDGHCWVANLTAEGSGHGSGPLGPRCPFPSQRAVVSCRPHCREPWGGVYVTTHTSCDQPSQEPRTGAGPTVMGCGAVEAAVSLDEILAMQTCLSSATGGSSSGHCE